MSYIRLYLFLCYKMWYYDLSCDSCNSYLVFDFSFYLYCLYSYVLNLKSHILVKIHILKSYTILQQRMHAQRALVWTVQLVMLLLMDLTANVQQASLAICVKAVHLFFPFSFFPNHSNRIYSIMISCYIGFLFNEHKCESCYWFKSVPYHNCAYT